MNNPLKIALFECKKAFYYCSFFSFFISIFTLASSIYSMQVLDRVLSSNSIETLIYLTLIMGVFLVFLGILTSVRSSVFLHISNQLDEKISPILFNKAIESEGVNKNISSQNLRDLQNVKSFISGPNLAALFDTPFAFVYLIVIFFIHPINGIITVVGALVMLKMAFLNQRLTKNLIEKTNKLQTQNIRDFEIISSNSEVVNAMAMRKNVLSRWRRVNDEFRLENSHLLNISAKITAISKSLRIAIQTITMASSAVLVMYNKMSSGGIIATSILAGKALAPFDQAVNLWKSLKTAFNSYQKLNKNLDGYEIEKGKIDLPQPKGAIAIEKLIYRLPQSMDMILKGISFDIDPGGVIGIIGPTGGGKTTLARLLVGVLKPSSGFIRYDGANIFDQDLEKIGKFVGYLPQDVELFQGSIKENIARMNPEAKDEDIIGAAKFCDVHDIILKMPQGYETQIQKDGSNLSAGQRQRIALARAYFGEVKFVVLDEPNSNLDSDGEDALNNTIKRAKEQGITTVVITHRTSVASFCDKILVLQNGEIKAFKTPQELGVKK
ncbi:MAG: type I secretion system permease/ATPase [Rickettsiales bacterium]|nr:type I secretion system permease/ATPase [Rickettsiales bacterium]